LLAGLNEYGANSDSFRDIETSRQTNMCGKHANGYDRDNLFGKITVEIQTAITFLHAGRDFGDETENGTEDIWWILEGKDYPRLWPEATTDDVTDFKT
jgi:hypothetical protein